MRSCHTAHQYNVTHVFILYVNMIKARGGILTQFIIDNVLLETEKKKAEVSVAALHSVIVPELPYGVEEKLIPEEGEASRQRRLDEARRQAFEVASHALLSGDLDGAVHQAFVASHLMVRNSGRR